MDLWLGHRWLLLFGYVAIRTVRKDVCGGGEKEELKLTALARHKGKHIYAPMCTGTQNNCVSYSVPVEAVSAASQAGEARN